MHYASTAMATLILNINVHGQQHRGLIKAGETRNMVFLTNAPIFRQDSDSNFARKFLKNRDSENQMLHLDNTFPTRRFSNNF